MSKDIFVSAKRAGTTVISSLYLQLDNMSQQEAAYHGPAQDGAIPYFRYSAYALQNYDIRQGDLLTDLNNIDPKTSAHTLYRVINDPEPFPDEHLELVLDKVRGT